MSKTKVSPLREALSRPRKKKGPLSILSQLLQDMMEDQGLHDLTVWERYMHRFVSDPLNGLPTASSGQKPAMNSARGNLRKELMKEIISWRVFCKGLRFLTLKSVKITLEANYKSGHVRSYSQFMVLASHDAETMVAILEETNNPHPSDNDDENEPELPTVSLNNFSEEVIDPKEDDPQMPLW